MTHSRSDWEDFAFALAIADSGSLSGAARGLGVNHTTVLRRLNGFEARLGVRLFDRLPGGVAPTPAGEEVIAAAREMAATTAEVERRIVGQDLRLSGPLRITTADTLATGVVPACLAAFATRHPEVELTLVSSLEMADLSRRDADVAIRPVADPPPHLVGRRIASIAFAIYVARAAAEPNGWIGVDGALRSSAVGRWHKARLGPRDHISARADALTTMAALAGAGVGRALLPCYLGDATPGLRRAGAIEPDVVSALWLLTHEDLRRTARVRAFMEETAHALTAEADLFEGRRPAAPDYRD